MKSHNKKYMLIVVGILFFFGVFFTSKSWMPDDRELRKLNYDQVITLNAWQIKVTDAQYDETLKSMTFQMYKRAVLADLNQPVMTLYLGKKSASKTPLEYKTEPLTIAEPDTKAVVLEGHTVTVYNVPKDFWYVSINLECEENKVAQTQPTDVFGQPIIGSTTQPKTLTAVIQMDTRKVSHKGA